MDKYNPNKIESKWQEKWARDKEYVRKENEREKYYMLDMFPYPSGDGLHMGHTESYTASDIIYRYKRLNGFNVLHPQGFDSFGLPAENYAIKTGVHPKVTTEKNAANYIVQMKMLGLGHDLENMVYTSRPDYYRWTQFLFAKFFEGGLVERKTDTINWCPSCNTGIANEQVEDSKCERCGTEIEQKEIPGWFFKITDFADELIEGLDKIDWPEHTKKNQRNWIGKSEGAKIKFSVIPGKRSEGKESREEESLEVFTTRPDTLFGATYMVIAPEHQLIANTKQQITNYKEVEEYIQKAKNKTEMERQENKEKTGIKIEGLKAINPATNEEIPIFVADYVLGGYGTGAIMAVPAHDARDYEFAIKFNLPIKQVVAPFWQAENDWYDAVREDLETVERRLVYALVKNPKDNKVLLLKWPGYNTHTFIVGGVEEGEDLVEAARREVLEETGYKNLKLIKEYNDEVHVKYCAVHKNQNRYAMAKCIQFELEDEERTKVSDDEKAKHEALWVTEEEAEKLLEYKNFTYFWQMYKKGEEVFVGNGNIINSGDFNGLDVTEAKEKITKFVGGEMTATYRLRDWSMSRQRYWGAPIPIVYSPEGEAKYVGDENLPWLLPEDVDFVPTGESPLKLSKELLERTEKIFGKGWTPEVDTMDTFVCSSWYFLRYPDTKNEQEYCSEEKLKDWLPVDFYIGGPEHTYMHLLYARFWVKAMHRLGMIDFDEPFMKLRHQGMVLDKQGVKMSKSKGNVVNPNDMVSQFGADATRLYMMFAGPLEDDVMWNEEGVKGVYRFLEKTWKVFNEIEMIDCGPDCRGVDEAILGLYHKTIKKVTDDIENISFNTAISAMMIFVNECLKQEKLPAPAMKNFLILLSPYAPHITEELWVKMGGKGSIFNAKWPKYDEAMLKDELIKIVVQVNGKLRDTLEVDADI
ncbi:leucine--tRNA ligase [Candidatus Parcubacteria bacterium]|nr:MAG: leucine--tRNA ligase [Candidatus Parcubacteria bacterium]